MTDDKVPYLCGGTLFFLLLTARNRKNNARERAQGMADGMADRCVMDGLVYAVTGSHNPSIDSTLKKDTSKYRECEISGSINIPFNDASIADTYRSAIDDQYNDVFRRMTEFVTSYLDEAKFNILGKYLLEVIEQDEIADDEPLYYDGIHHPATKAELRVITDFNIQPFLIGIMRFILDHRKDNAGKATLEEWGVRSLGNERKFTKTDLGSSIIRKITLTLAEEIIQEKTQTATNTNSHKSSHDIIYEKIFASGKAMAGVWGKVVDALARDNTEKNKAENIEAEVVDDDEPSGTADDNVSYAKHAEPDSPRIQIVQNPTIYNQHAEKIYNIEHVDYLD